jgi:hypothetical protein
MEKRKLNVKKGQVFHLDQWYELMQGTQDLYEQINEATGEPDDTGDICRANIDFEIIVTIKRNRS